MSVIYWCLGIFVFGICYYLFIPFRLMLAHPFKHIYNSYWDLVKYIYYKKWNECNKSDLICYAGLFGKGKTLSAVHACVSMYNRYNNKKVFDYKNKRWVTQKVKIISNVHFKTIPYEYMKSLSQIVSFCENQSKLDYENKEQTILFVLIDEASVQLNSRNFKDNIDPNFLNTLLTCRHYNIKAIYYTSQRFKLTDKLLRDVTQKVVDCNKIWRWQVQKTYDAWEYENANNPTLIRPMFRGGWFVTNADYDAYDTYACVEDLAKSCKSGDMLSEQEILALRCNTDTSIDYVTNTSRKYKKLQKQSIRKKGA